MVVELFAIPKSVLTYLFSAIIGQLIAWGLRDLVEAIQNPKEWPRFQYLLEDAAALFFSYVTFVFDLGKLNACITAIACSVTKKNRTSPYRKPCWLKEGLRSFLSSCFCFAIYLLVFWLFFFFLTFINFIGLWCEEYIPHWKWERTLSDI